MATNKAQHVEIYALECYRAFRFLAWALLPCGIDLKDEIVNREGNIRTCCEIFFTLLTVTFLLSFTIFWVFILYNVISYNQPLTVSCILVTSLCFAFDGVMFRLILIKKNLKLKAIFNSLHYCCSETIQPNNECWPIHKITTYFVNSSFASMVALFIFCKLFDDQGPDSVSPESMVYYIPVEANATLVTIKPIIDVVLNLGTVFVIVYHMLFVIFYSALCVIIISVFKHLTYVTLKAKDQQPRGPSNITIVFQRRLIKDFMNGHRMMCNVVKEMNDLFKELVAVWTLFEFLSLIFSLRVFNLGSDEQYIDREILSLVLVLLMSFSLRTLLAARINDQVLDSLNQFSSFDTNGTLVSCKEEDNTFYFILSCISKVHIEFQLYSLNVHLDPPMLSGWSLFVIRKTLLISTAANALTYLLVLYSIKY